MSNPEPVLDVSKNGHTFTDQESQVVLLFANGMDVKEIARMVYDVKQSKYPEKYFETLKTIQAILRNCYHRDYYVARNGEE